MLWCAAPGQAEASWKRLDSEHLVVIGDARDAEIRAAARRFEAFHAALRRIHDDEAPSSARIVVIVCGSGQSFDALRPRFNGAALREIGGYFQQGPETSYIVLGPSGDSDDTRRLVFHEFAHALIASGSAMLPPWINEGLAEFYSTFDLRFDGRGGQTGGPIRHHLAALRDRVMPLAELLAVGYDSPFYNESSRRSAFYAGSWVLVHYLLQERRASVSDLFEYAARTTRGEDAAAMFSAVFGVSDASMDRELAGYARRPVLGASTVVFDTPVRTEAARAPRLVTDADVDAAVADLFFLQRRDDDAYARATRAVAAGGASASGHASATAQTVLGQLELRRGTVRAAVTHFRTAAQGSADDFAAHYHLGRTLLDDAQRAARADARLDEACRALTRATTLRPESGAAWAALARCQLRRGEQPEAALASAQRAVAAEPRELDHRIVVARAHLARRDLAATRAALEPVETRGRASAVEQARQLLRTARAIEDEAEARAVFLERGDDDRALQRVRNSLAGLPPDARAAASPPRETTLAGSLRPLGPHETRERGYFRRIDCQRADVVVHVERAEGPRRVGGVRMEQVLVFSYRDDVTGDITCGATHAGTTVLITWTTASAPGVGGELDGRVVALEFVPPGYVPE
jgi:tetratricopeptide (TPR) repeat protein